MEITVKFNLPNNEVSQLAKYLDFLVENTQITFTEVSGPAKEEPKKSKYPVTYKNAYGTSDYDKAEYISAKTGIKYSEGYNTYTNTMAYNFPKLPEVFNAAKEYNSTMYPSNQ